MNDIKKAQEQAAGQYFDINLKKRLIEREFRAVVLLVGIVSLALGALAGMMGMATADLLLAAIGIVVILCVVMLD